MAEKDVKRIVSVRRGPSPDSILATYLSKRLTGEASKFGVPWSALPNGDRTYSEMHLAEELTLTKGFHVDLAKTLWSHCREKGYAPPYEVVLRRCTVETEDGSQHETLRVSVLHRGRFEKTGRELFDEAVKATEAIIAEG